MMLDRRMLMAGSAAATAGALSGCAASGGVAEAQGAGGASPHAHTKSFFFASPVETTWRAFTEPDQRRVWFGHPSPPLANALEVRPPNYFKSVTDHPGLPGPIEMTATFEAVDGGTRLTHTNSGFGDSLEWQNALQTSAHGVDEMMGDLALYLRTGAGSPRHTVFRSFDLLKGTREVPGGLEVFEVYPNTLAAEVGLLPGDTVVGLAGAGVYGFTQVHFAIRTRPPGEVVEVKWVRGDQVMTGTGRMTATVSLRTTR